MTLKKDKEDQSKYYLSNLKPIVLDIKWENRDIYVVEWTNKVFPSIKWGLGENVVVRLMECLTPTVSFDIFMGNYFTSFRLLTHLGVNSSNSCAQQK